MFALFSPFSANLFYFSRFSPHYFFYLFLLSYPLVLEPGKLHPTLEKSEFVQRSKPAIPTPKVVSRGGRGRTFFFSPSNRHTRYNHVGVGRSTMRKAAIMRPDGRH